MINNYKEIKEILDLSISVDGDTEITFIDNEGNGKKNYWICDYELLEYIKQLQQRIDKSIEHIEKNSKFVHKEDVGHFAMFYREMEDVTELLDILKGDEDNEVIQIQGKNSRQEEER